MPVKASVRAEGNPRGTERAFQSRIRRASTGATEGIKDRNRDRATARGIHLAGDSCRIEYAVRYRSAVERKRAGEIAGGVGWQPEWQRQRTAETKQHRIADGNIRQIRIPCIGHH